MRTKLSQSLKVTQHLSFCRASLCVSHIETILLEKLFQGCESLVSRQITLGLCYYLFCRDFKPMKFTKQCSNIFKTSNLTLFCKLLLLTEGITLSKIKSILLVVVKFRFLCFFFVYLSWLPLEIVSGVKASVLWISPTFFKVKFFDNELSLKDFVKKGKRNGTTLH